MAEHDDMRLGELEILRPERVVLVHGNEVGLTSREFEILAMLAEHPGWVFSADQLSGDPDEGDHSPDSVSVLVSRVRQKLTAAGAPEVVETVRGFGYRLRHQPPGDEHGESVESSETRAELKEALWQLQQTVIEVEHAGSPEQRRAASALLEQVRRSIYASLAE